MMVDGEVRVGSFIDALHAAMLKYGDLPICGGDLHSERPPQKITPLNANGEDVTFGSTIDKRAVSFYIQ